jgi:hypothetical protein
MHKFRDAVLEKRATCCPRAAPAMFGQRGQLPTLPRVSGATALSLNAKSYRSIDMQFSHKLQFYLH